VYSKDPERLKKRKELMDQIIEKEREHSLREQRKQRRERGLKQKYLHNVGRKPQNQNRLKPIKPPKPRS